MASLTATAEPDSTPPRVLLELDMSDLAGPPTEADIIRRDPDGRVRPVRFADPAALTTGEWQGYDYEAPFGEEVTYEATAGTTTVYSAAVTLDSDVAWLRHPGFPSLSLPVSIEGKGEDVRPIDRGVFPILNRKTPVVVSSVRKAASSSLSLHTFTLSEEASLLGLLEDGQVLLLSEPSGSGWGLGSFYLSIGDVTESRPGEASESLRVFSFPYDVVDQPAGVYQAQFTYSDVITDHATYQAVFDVYDAYTDLLANNRNDV